jgi:hypothetical protein
LVLSATQWLCSPSFWEGKNRAIALHFSANPKSAIRNPNFLRYSFQLNKRTQLCDDHLFLYLHATGKTGAILCDALPAIVIPHLAVGAVAIPAKITVGNRLDREVLKTSQEPVVFGHLKPLSEDFYRD